MPRLGRLLLALLAFALVATACSSSNGDKEADENQPKSPCNEASSVSADDYKPGDLIKSTELKPEADDPNFPQGARAWRILYASTGNDNTDMELVCGVVVAPEDASKISAAGAGENQGRMVTWSHGTIGLESRCQPSMNPANNVWGAMPSGINLVAWGKAGKDNGRLGTPQDGALQHMINQGWVVPVTDYYADLGAGPGLEPYVMGKTEAANTIDSGRAAHQLLQKEYTSYGVDSYEYMTWGHSQGGHSAAWAAQLAEPYNEATKSEKSPELVLRGAALLAPATTIVVQADRQPYTANYYGLADWVSGQKMGPPIFGEDLVPLGPALFSFILGAWTQWSAEDVPKADQMPAFPPEATNLDLESIVTDSAVGTIGEVTKLCLEAQPLEVLKATAKYDFEPFLIPSLQNGREIDGQMHGNIDVTCAGEPEAALAKWCDWMRYQTPGPIGSSDLPKLPKNGDALVPVYIADGTNDLIVRCASSMDAAEQKDVLPNAKDCLSHAFYEAMATGAYCPKGEKANGYLQLDLWQQNPLTTPADHFSVPGMAAAKSLLDPSFEGSPLQKFMDGAFDQDLKPECVAPRLMNPTSDEAGTQ